MAGALAGAFVGLGTGDGDATGSGEGEGEGSGDGLGSADADGDGTAGPAVVRLVTEGPPHADATTTPASRHTRQFFTAPPPWISRATTCRFVLFVHIGFAGGP